MICDPDDEAKNLSFLILSILVDRMEKFIVPIQGSREHEPYHKFC